MVDSNTLGEILRFLSELPAILVYFVVGIGAAVENVFPPVPADTFVVAGSFIAEGGKASPIGVFAATWLCNVGSALTVFGLGRRYGPTFFRAPFGGWLLKPKQLQRLAGLYDRYGGLIIFLSRFLPGFRAIVPVFAGVAGLGFWRTATPLAFASAIWYGFLVYIGALARRNLDEVVRVLGNLNVTLLIIALVLASAIGWAWWRTRHPREDSRSEIER